MEREMKLKRYHELFPDDSIKARAFDAIATEFYAGNFGHMAKSDIEVLLFHLYIEKILDIDEHNFNSYSDFRLSKELGIPQSKIQTLKVKKQLQYPHSFSWQKAFAIVSDNARYEGGKIKIQIPDINLFSEIRNAVEESGGYIDMTLTPKLLQVSPEYFLDLLLLVQNEDNRDSLRKKLRGKLNDSNKDREFLDTEPFGKQLAHFSRDVAINTISSVLTAGVTGELALAEEGISLVKNILKVLPVTKKEN